MENQPLLAGSRGYYERRKNAITIASTAFIAAVAVIFLVVNAKTMNRTTVLVAKDNKAASLTTGLTAAQKAEQKQVECFASVGLFGELFCPGTNGGKFTQGLISKGLNEAEEVVHSLAPSSAKDTADVKSAKTDADSTAHVADDAAVKSIKSDDGQDADVPPIDCACCHSKCQKSGIYKDPKKRHAPHSYWCVKQGRVGSPTYCPAQDYNCLCCDRVRVQLQGSSCA